MIDFIEDFWGLIIVVVVFIVLVYALSKQEEKEYKRHMTECLKDHKEYECVAMLKTNTEYYPVVVPMNIGR